MQAQVCALPPATAVCGSVATYAVAGAAFVVASTVVYATDAFDYIFEYVNYTPFKNKWVPGYLHDTWNDHKYQLKDIFGGKPPSENQFAKRCIQSYDAGKKYIDSKTGRQVSFEKLNSTYGLFTVIEKAGNQHEGKTVTCYKRRLDEFLKKVGENKRFKDLTSPLLVC
ncbi:MAG: hypothetical protein AABW85_01370 [archaeon]